MALTTSATQREPGTGRRPWRTIAFAAVWWALSFGLTLATYPFINDHFGRISAARQIARYGEFPFRDFFDPGYVLTEFASAAIQLLFGESLIGEMLWTSACIATGAAVVIMLARRVAPSRVSVMVIGAIVLLAIPRPYDFDKALFYPLGILLCWRYIDRPTAARLWTLAAVAVVAGMFRYDNGLFMSAAGLVAVAARHARDTRTLGRHAILLAGALAVCAVPYLVFLQVNGGISNAANQMLTYARREGGGTRLTALPPLVPSELGFVYHPDYVQVRWAPSADDDRTRLEAQYTLHNGAAQGNPANRVSLYEVDDTSPRNLRALVNDPQIVDTHLIDRATGELEHQGSWLRRLYWKVPVMGHWTLTWPAKDAANSLYWVFLLLPTVAVVFAWRSRAPDHVVFAKVLSAATMAACVAALILRVPLTARMTGAAAPTVILAAWLWHHIHAKWTARIVACVIVITSAVVAEWDWTFDRLLRTQALHEVFSEATKSPPSSMLLPSGSIGGMVEYVRRCTEADDRVFAGWFVPELFYFSGRAFAGGVAAFFGGHWSEAANQHRIVTKLASESVPLVILRSEDRDFEDTYAEINAYFQKHYRSAGTTTFGDSDSATYLLLTRKDRAPTRTDSASSLPCFADPD